MSLVRSRCAGVTMSSGSEGRSRALLATLLLVANRVVSAERLIDDLREKPPESGEHALRVRVSELRKALALEGEQSPISTRAPGYVMLLRRDQLDLFRFEDRLERGSNASPMESSPRRRMSCVRRSSSGAGPPRRRRARGFRAPAAMRLEELPRLHALELRIEAERSPRSPRTARQRARSLVDRPPAERVLSRPADACAPCTERGASRRPSIPTGRLKRLVSELGLSRALPQALEQEILRHDPSLEHPSARPKSCSRSTRRRRSSLAPTAERRRGARRVAVTRGADGTKTSARAHSHAARRRGRPAPSRGREPKHASFRPRAAKSSRTCGRVRL